MACGFGIIVNMSSGAGRLGYPGGSAYVSTKFTVEGLSESMAYELEPFGIKVILVESGVIRTDLLMLWLLPRNPKILILHIRRNAKSGYKL